VAVENIESLLTNADFTIVRTGSAGLRDLQFVLAKNPA
jgi:hypothetical protein